MRWRTLTPRSRLRLVAWCLLGIGLLGALTIYVLAPPETEDPLGDPSQSKRYVHDMELYGGKANVLQDEFRRWFDGLWRGKQLASTVTCISAFLFLALQFAASPFRFNTPLDADRRAPPHENDGA